MAKITINGEKPHRYADQKIGELKEPAFMNYYYTVDSVEIGVAYSLHKNEVDAERFIPDSWWCQSRGPGKVFVSKKTLDEIVKSKEKVVFIDWEN